MIDERPRSVRGWRCVGPLPYNGNTYEYGWMYVPVGLHLLWKLSHWVNFTGRLRVFLALSRAGLLDMPEGGDMTFANLRKHWRWDRSGWARGRKMRAS